MHCNCVGLVYFPVIAWNTLEDLQNYSHYSRLYVISSLITCTAQSRKSFFFSKLQNPNPVRFRFLLKKPEFGSCRTQPESGSKKSKIQSMHTSGIWGVVSIGFFTWRCNTVLNTLINSLDVKFYWFTTRLIDRVLGRCWRLIVVLVWHYRT